MKSHVNPVPLWQRATVWTGIALGYLGAAVFGVAAMFEFINTSTIILGLLLVGAGVLVGQSSRFVRHG